MPENFPCVTYREFNYRPQKQIKHVFFPPPLMISYQLIFISLVVSVLAPPPPQTHCIPYGCFQRLLALKGPGTAERKGWPWGIYRRNWRALPHNDMDSIWIISILWIYLLLKVFPLRWDLWSPDHGRSALALPMAVPIETGPAASPPHHLTQTASGCHLAPICFLSSKCLK